jgi:mannosyltransferase PIG-V
VDTASEAVWPSPHDRSDGSRAPALAVNSLPPSPAAPVAEPSATVPATRRRSRRVGAHRLSADLRRELVWITVIYLAARAAVLIAAVLLDALGHHNLQGELLHWDGLWYRDVADNGYPRHIAHPYHQDNLGFFPLYPVTIWMGEHVLQVLGFSSQIWRASVAAVFIAGVGGWIATVFVHRLTEGWWDRPTARRATALFVVFPGAVVFSMGYSEGLLLPLTAVCIWALERRRWVLAGAMAAFGTAVQPVGLALGAICGICALRELWVGGLSGGHLGRALRSRGFRMSVLTTAMSGIGVGSFMGFLWAWTGDPLANLYAQHHGWSEKTDPFALVHLVTREVPRFDPNHFNHPWIDLNDVSGFLGAILMAYELWLLWRYRHELTLPAISWTLIITFLAFTSEYVPPNPRMQITAFPMLVLLARRVRRQGFALILFLNSFLLIGMGLLTFYKHVLRP